MRNAIHPFGVIQVRLFASCCPPPPYQALSDLLICSWRLRGSLISFASGCQSTFATGDEGLAAEHGLIIVRQAALLVTG